MAHVSPWSLLYKMPAWGTRSLSINCMANTNVPSLQVIPRPGPWKKKYHSGCFNSGVRLIGADHVRPSSVLFAITNCAVWSLSMPGLELTHARWLPIPWVQAATTQHVLLALSTRIAGSPTPFCAAGRPPFSPKAKGKRMGSHVFPPSMLRLSPTSMCSCRSVLLL